MNDKEYNSLPGLRRSDLFRILTSPMHFKYHMEHREESTPALVFGQAAHKLILEPESFLDEFAIIPAVDRRTKSGKQEHEEFTRQAAGKTWISEDDFKTIKVMRDAIMADSYFADIIEGGEHEVATLWTDEETGVQLKLKADIVDTANRIIYDYKTAISCADGVFEKSARRYGYDFQAGFYCSGMEAETLERYAFAFIAQEKTPPYAFRLYTCDRGFIAAGKNKFRRAVNLYHECKLKNEWPGYGDETLYAEEW